MLKLAELLYIVLLVEFIKEKPEILFAIAVLFINFISLDSCSPMPLSFKFAVLLLIAWLVELRIAMPNKLLFDALLLIILLGYRRSIKNKPYKFENKSLLVTIL